MAEVGEQVEPAAQTWHRDAVVKVDRCRKFRCVRNLLAGEVHAQAACVREALVLGAEHAHIRAQSEILRHTHFCTGLQTLGLNLGCVLQLQDGGAIRQGHEEEGLIIGEFAGKSGEIVLHAPTQEFALHAHFIALDGLGIEIEPVRDLPCIDKIRVPAATLEAGGVFRIQIHVLADGKCRAHRPGQLVFRAIIAIVDEGGDAQRAAAVEVIEKILFFAGVACAEV